MTDLAQHSVVHRTLRTNRRARSATDVALAKRMLALLQAGKDQRGEKIAAARQAIAEEAMDTPMKLQIALDRMIDEVLESE
jgi:hypothetical protein